MPAIPYTIVINPHALHTPVKDPQKEQSLPSAPSGPEETFREQARRLLRQWLASNDNVLLDSIDTLGRRAVSGASEASRRLDRTISFGQSAASSLDDLQALMADLGAPAQPRRRSLFKAAPKNHADPQTRLEALVESLDRERDNVARSLITIESDSTKLRAAAAELDDALALIRACAAAVDAAGRELMFDQPTRARFLCDTARTRLLSREQDVATQLAVTQQGILTLQLLIDGQHALAQALGRARDTSIAALRTAIAAQRALTQSQDMARQAEALERTARAAEEAPATRGDFQRVLDDAVDQVRRAILAAQTAQRGTPL
ncbi:toxic anion resistance protein [Sphingomonas sp. HT-1]|uniref:toxic anion resistance protein n=1 Tax=Sphingomonas sp. HT-1 TaxID=3400348 RepID=UPI003AFFB56D